MIGEHRLLDALGQAVIATDAAGTITYWNQQAERLFGWSAAEATGRAVLEVTPAATVVDEAGEIMEALSQGQPWSGEMLLRRKDGSTFLARVTDAPVLDDAGRLVAIVGVSEDVSEQRRAEARLRREDERLRVALSGGHLGTWEWDRVSGVVVIDEQMQTFLGLESDTFAGTFEEYVDLVHPEDRPGVLHAIRSSLDEGGTHEVEHRILHPDGSTRWINARGHSVHDDQGAVTGLVGVIADVTDRKLAEEERERLLLAEATARAEAEASQARIQFLAEATATLTESLAVDERLQRLVRFSVPVLCDACVVHVVDEEVAVTHRAVQHREPGGSDRLRQVVERCAVAFEEAVGVATAMHTGATWSGEVDEALRAAGLRSDECRDLLLDLDLREAVSVPIRGRGRVIGAATFLTTGNRRLDDGEVELAEALCGRAGVAIVNALLVAARERSERALRFQSAVLGSLNDAAADGIVVVDPDGQVLFHNQRFVDLWGFAPGLVATRSDPALLDAAQDRVVDPEGFITRVRAIYDDPSRPARDEVHLVDGTILDRYGTPLRSPEGDYFGWAWHFRDITAERRKQEEIVRASERNAALARTLQQSLLPPALPDIAGVDLAARYHPAYEGLDVGGDFYDVFAVGGDWMLVLGDVCGKGAEAASLTALVRHTVRSAAIHADSLSDMLTEVNDVMLAHEPDPLDRRFVTLCVVRICTIGDHLDAEVACAGHEPPLVVHADGSVERVMASGTVLGLVENFTATTVELAVEVGSAIVAVTDGITEARSPDRSFFGVAGLEAVLRQVAGRDPAAIATAVLDAALDWQHGTARDDIALLVARPAG